MEGIRHANIGIAVVIAITIAGVLAFRNSEAALELVGLAALCGGIAVTIVLTERAERRKEKRALSS